MSEHTANRTIGTVLMVFPGPKFSIGVEGRLDPVKAHASTGMRKKIMKVQVGDKVWVEPITGLSEWRILELISS